MSPGSLTLDAVLAEQPKLHKRGGQPISWQLNDDVLRLIDAEARPDWRTIETGEGISTILFALKGTEHTCVTPNYPAVERIQAYCAEHDLSLDRVRFEVGGSQDVLPRLEATPLDLALVDGGHGFPIPFFDYWYMSQRLRQGGLLIVDDVQLWTGYILKGFLESEPEWSVYRDWSPRTMVFRKEVDAIPYKEWTMQPYFTWNLDRLQHGTRWRRAWSLLRKGEFGELRRRIERRLRPSASD
jgi:predicted O-methyltransferase YrrM